MPSNPPSQLPLYFTLEAQDDLEHILQYSLATWGEAHAEAYGQKLNQAFQRIQNHPLTGIMREDVFPDYRVMLVERHLVFYWTKPNETVIIRILHQRQDPKGHF